MSFERKQMNGWIRHLIEYNDTMEKINEFFHVIRWVKANLEPMDYKFETEFKTDKNGNPTLNVTGLALYFRTPEVYSFYLLGIPNFSKREDND